MRASAIFAGPTKAEFIRALGCNQVTSEFGAWPLRPKGA